MRPRALLALVLPAVAVLASDCRRPGNPAPTTALGALDGGAGVCTEMKTGDFTRLVFGAPPAPRGPFDPAPPPPLPQGTGDNVKFALTRAWRLGKTAQAFEKEIIDACVELGVAAGVPERELRAEPDLGHGAERACSAAAGRVAGIFRRAKESKVVLDVQVETTHCFVDIEPTRNCLALCGTPPVGDLRAHCIGGELEGVCTGHCSGSCLLPPGPGVGLCHGACAGHCDREFRGTCGGKCTGTCDGAPTKGSGRCAGICEGACNDNAAGICAGRCDGSCGGWWDQQAPSAKCSGVCVGACSGAIHDGLCSGEYAPRGIEPVCQAACGAEAAMSLRCDTPLVRAAVRSGKASADLQRTLAGVQSAVPKILRLQQGAAKRLPHAIDNAISSVVDWSNAFATAGPHPLICIRETVDAMREASKWIELASRAMEVVSPAIKTEPLVQGRPEDE